MSVTTDIHNEGLIAEIFMETVEALVEQCRNSAATAEKKTNVTVQHIDLNMEFSKVGVARKRILFSSMSTEQGVTIRLTTRIYVADSI